MAPKARAMVMGPTKAMSVMAWRAMSKNIGLVAMTSADRKPARRETAVQSILRIGRCGGRRSGVGWLLESRAADRIARMDDGRITLVESQVAHE